jgi:lipoprotein-anchoring transpeptidase ErfK/SrfK
MEAVMIPLRRLLMTAAAAAALSVLVWQPAHADATVVVRRGDNVFRLALRHGTTVQAIVAANGLRSADRIYVGQRLLIPGSTAQPSGASGGAVVGVHVVRPGENLFRISQRYGTTVQALVRANGLPSADMVRAGRRLRIPGGTGSGRASQSVGAPVTASGGGPGRQIVIDLSSQRLLALQGGRSVASFPVSTGKTSTPTPVGTYRVYTRYRSQRMVGPGYNLPGVPYVQYFHGSYAIHGTYWHNAFGVPVSHGCVNMRQADAAWLWSWASYGTPVVVRW